MGVLIAALIPVNVESATVLPSIVCLNTVRNWSFSASNAVSGQRCHRRQP